MNEYLTWEQAELKIISIYDIDESDRAEVLEGNCMHLRSKRGLILKVYMDHETNEAFVAFPEETSEAEKQNTFRALEALHYIPVEVD